MAWKFQSDTARHKQDIFYIVRRRGNTLTTQEYSTHYIPDQNDFLNTQLYIKAHYPYYFFKLTLGLVQ